MKKIISLILFMAVVAVYAQSFEISYNGEPVGEEFNFYVENANDDNELIFIITNTSSEEISISLSRRVVSEVPGSYNIFCFGGGCYDSQDYANNPMVLQPGETSEGSDFHFVYNPGGNEGTTSVNYSFTSAGYSVSVLVNYIYSTVGISSSDLSVNSLAAYPNPASTSVTVSYDLSGLNSDARLVITNLVGSKVAVRSLNGNSGKVNIDLSNLDAGIYFYSIEANGQAISTRKLIVK